MGHMAKRRKLQKGGRRRSRSSGDVAEKLRAALRSIIREWKTLRKPLPVEEVPNPIPKGGQRYRVRGAQSYEEIQERIIRFAGRVWQLKDGLISWLQTKPDMQLVFADANTNSTLVGTGGENAKPTIEEAAEFSLPLLLCADLYNTHKHYTDCNRSGYQPFLSGVQFDTSKAGTCGIQYDGARKTGDITVSRPDPVPIRAAILSRNTPVDFGDAVVNVTRAFNHWIPLVRQMELLSPNDRGDKAILDDLAEVEQTIETFDPFKPGDKAVENKQLPLEQRRLAFANPARFVAELEARQNAETADAQSQAEPDSG